jgi:hypothetical protein
MIIINSFPRTGNKYLLVYLQNIFNLKIQSEDSESFHNLDLLKDPSIKQIVILRKPQESIVSLCALQMHIENSTTFNLDGVVSSWAEWHKIMLENIDHLYPFLFEQVIKNPSECLMQLSKSLSIDTAIDDFASQLFHSTYTGEGNHIATSIKMSSRLSDHYDQIKEQYKKIDRNTHKKINWLYHELLLAIKKRQELLHIVV